VPVFNRRTAYRHLLVVGHGRSEPGGPPARSGGLAWNDGAIGLALFAPAAILRILVRLVPYDDGPTASTGLAERPAH
jgi:hypothetical protein